MKVYINRNVCTLTSSDVAHTPTKGIWKGFNRLAAIIVEELYDNDTTALT